MKLYVKVSWINNDQPLIRSYETAIVQIDETEYEDRCNSGAGYFDNYIFTNIFGKYYYDDSRKDLVIDFMMKM